MTIDNKEILLVTTDSKESFLVTADNKESLFTTAGKCLGNVDLPMREGMRPICICSRRPFSRPMRESYAQAHALCASPMREDTKRRLDLLQLKAYRMPMREGMRERTK